jgi:hypothetical protein
MGFPDVSWDNYFAPQPGTRLDFSLLVGELLAAPKEKKS